MEKEFFIFIEKTIIKLYVILELFVLIVYSIYSI